ncbi:hypothetical protein C5167_005576, partial [Papaver somniferum]
WKSIPFTHPTNLDTVAMDSDLKDKFEHGMGSLDLVELDEPYLLLDESHVQNSMMFNVQNFFLGDEDDADQMVAIIWLPHDGMMGRQSLLL